MFFYIDESGHTGPKLFDPAQPMLYYGVLSSRVDVDVVAVDRLQSLRIRCGVERLHAAELGNPGLVKIVEDLAELQHLLDINFYIFRVNKPDHAIISFFDQVFEIKGLIRQSHGRAIGHPCDMFYSSSLRDFLMKISPSGPGTRV